MEEPARPHTVVSLEELIRAMPGVVEVVAARRPGGEGQASSAADLPISGIALHSGNVRPGDLFVAVRGFRSDGHRYVDEALARGARAVVVARPEVAHELARREVVPWVVLVRDERAALSWAAAQFYGHPSRRLLVVGVTGTVGKTSVALFLARLLELEGRAAGAVGSLGVVDGRGRHTSSGLTTPDPITLHRALAEMEAQGIEAATVEISTHGILQQRASALELGAGVVTDIVPFEHADVHPTFEHYVETKRRFFDLLRPGAPIAYSASSPHTVALARRWPLRRRVRYVVEAGGDLYGEPDGEGGGFLAGRVTATSLEGTTMALDWTDADGGRQRTEVRAALLGVHAVRNAVGAAAALLAMEMPLDGVWRGLEQLRPLPRRMEVIYRGEFAVIDDTTGHPASFRHLFETLRATAPRRLVLLVGVRGSRGVTINERNGDVIAAWARRLPMGALVVTDSRDMTAPSDAVLPEESAALTGALDRSGVGYRHVPHLEDAVEEALRQVRPGDVLVLAGAQGLNRAADLLRRRLGVDRQPAGPSGI